MKRFIGFPAPLIRPLAVLMVTVMVCLPLTGCKNSEPLSADGFFFDTVIKVSLYQGGSQELLQECLDLCSHYEQLFSRTVPQSDISRINAAKGRPVTVSEETVSLLRTALSYCQLSGGRFDITIAPLSSLWDFEADPPKIPDQDSLKRAAAHVDYRRVRLQGNTVSLEDPEAALDLGGAAKGYIADRLRELLVSHGVSSALIDLGGNILTVGQKPDGSDFNIGIQMPFEDRNTAMTSVRARDLSVVSSGVYERYFIQKGSLYHHILNKETGYPIGNNLLGVTILSERSTDGDCLSTACFTLGLEDGMALVESLDGVEALFITRDYELHPSSGFPL